MERRKRLFMSNFRQFQSGDILIVLVDLKAKEDSNNTFLRHLISRDAVKTTLKA